MKRIFNPAVLNYDINVIGPWLMALPVFVVVVLTALAALLVPSVQPNFIADLLTAAIEAFLPLGAGIVLAAISARDPALELLLTMPTPYRVTMFRRFAMILLSTAVTGGVTTLLYNAIFLWSPTNSLWSSQLAWLAPMLWLAGAGGLLALLMRSYASAGAALGGIWIMQLVFHGYFATINWLQPWFLFATLYTPATPFWLTNRIELLVAAVVMFMVIWWYLGHNEWRLHGEDA